MIIIVNCLIMFIKTLVCFVAVFSFGCLADTEIRNNDIYKEENDFSSIERPCRVYDMFCIRKYFVKHSRCKETYGPAPDPLYKAQSTFNVPRVNLTVTSLKVKYSGINGKVDEFYINKKTDKLLLAVEFTDFIFTSNENYFRFHRRGKEPIVNRETIFNTTYPSFVVTIIIPNLKDLQLQNSEVFIYFDNPSFSQIVAVGPNAFTSTDPQVQETFVKFLADFKSNVQEGLLSDETFFIGSFIQYNICDFGIELL